MPSQKDTGFVVAVTFSNQNNKVLEKFEKEFGMNHKLSSVSKFIHDVTNSFCAGNKALDSFVSYDLKFLIKNEPF